MQTALTTIAIMLGLIGTALGIINSCLQLNARRVRLRVTPVLGRGVGAAPLPHDRACPGVEVVNLSAFPVTVSDVGLCSKRKRRTRKGTFSPGVFSNGQGLPQRLEPREGFTVYVLDRPEQMEPMHYAYVQTTCGVMRFGRSKALDGFMKRRGRASQDA